MEEQEIFLRHFTIEDAPTLLEWGQNSRYHQLAGFEKIDNLEQAKQAAKRYAARQASYAICLKDNRKVIGLVELYERGVDERSGLDKTKEVGFMLTQAYEGHGYMTQALNKIFEMAFKQEGQEEIWSSTIDDNFHAQSLLEKLGFKYIYQTDYSQISNLFSFNKKYYLLKRADWLKIDQNTKS